VTSKMWLLATSFFVGIIPFGYSRIWAQDSPETGFHASVDGQFRYGNIEGFVQIPRGGGAGSTSNERPKFDEMGINQAAIGAPSLTLGWNNHNIYGVARIIRLSGSDDLDTTLISNGTTFPAGTHVNANTRLDWYGLGYEYRFAYKYNSAGSVVTFYPAIGFALLNFDYNLNGTPGLSASRGFTKAAPQLGLKSEWIPGGPFSLSAGVLSSLPFSTLPLLLSVDLTAGYQLWGRHDHGGMAYLGVGYDRINEEDNQKVPNHIKASIGPELVVGFKVSF
jgi:hypothetical protein